MASPRYSLYRYGLPPAGNTLRRSFLGAGTLRLSCLARQDILRTVSVSERLRLTSNLSSGMGREAALNAALTVSARAKSQFKREIRAWTALGLTASADMDRASAIEQRAALGLRAYLSGDRASRYEAEGRLGMGARLTACVFRACALRGSVKGAAAACANSTVKLHTAAGLYAAGHACKDSRISLNRLALLTFYGALGKQEGRKLSMRDGVHLESRGAKNCPRAVTGSSGLFLSASSGYLEGAAISVRCTIPPGGKLVVDTGRYTVTLDGENILHLQEGDWPMLSRELLSLSVASGTGGPLEGYVAYQEAYL